MRVKLSREILLKIQVINKRDKKLSRKIEKQLALFEENPKHPSLRKHKLSGDLDNLWSISITLSIRMVYKLIDTETAYFTKIGTHKEVYKKN